MQEYFFANYRLLVDDEISTHEGMQYLDGFKSPMPYKHTFTVHLGNSALLEAEHEKAIHCPEVCKSETFSIYDVGNAWSLVTRLEEFNWTYVTNSSRDYSESIIYMPTEPSYVERNCFHGWVKPHIPFTRILRVFCEAGMVMRDGLPIHASLVEKGGFGILFLGSSGMGKSTQARLWQKYQNADFIIGDRPCLRCIDGVWYGFGMPWDGKDNIKKQTGVPIKALVQLEQARENRIARLDAEQAMMVLLHQAMMPMWDDVAVDKAMTLMARLSGDLPFYHLANLANEAATVLTDKTIFS